MAARDRDERPDADGGRSPVTIAGAGAAAGAVAGAAVGAVAGPLGAAAGAVGGAVVGGIVGGVAAQGMDTGAPAADQELAATRADAAPHDPLAAGKPQEVGNRAHDRSDGI